MLHWTPTPTPTLIVTNNIPEKRKLNLDLLYTSKCLMRHSFNHKIKQQHKKRLNRFGKTFLWHQAPEQSLHTPELPMPSQSGNITSRLLLNSFSSSKSFFSFSSSLLIIIKIETEVRRGGKKLQITEDRMHSFCLNFMSGIHIPTSELLLTSVGPQVSTITQHSLPTAIHLSPIFNHNFTEAT